jgi:hypothetical protein
MNRIKALALAAATVAVMSVGISTQADAGPFFGRRAGFAFGALATGIVVGGAIAAANSRAYASDCYLTRRWVDTPYGVEHRTVRVCE